MARGRSIPRGWAIDSRGKPIRNGRVAALERRLTPLGSSPENASYKGYGLAAMVEILCGALSPAAGGSAISSSRSIRRAFARRGPSNPTSTRWRPGSGATRPIDPGRPVLVAGDPEREARERRLESGIPLSRSVIEDMRTVARGSGVPFDL